MADLRALSHVPGLAHARRLLGRVLGSVGLGDAPDSALPGRDAQPHIAAHVEPRVDPSPPREAAATTARVEPTLAAEWLEDAAWSGLRFSSNEDGDHLAWRAIEGADTLRTVEVRCALGEPDASPEVTIRDRPLTSSEGALRFVDDALRRVVSLGTLEGGRFVSLTHANVR